MPSSAMGTVVERLLGNVTECVLSTFLGALDKQTGSIQSSAIRCELQSTYGSMQ
jgi:hypothetical protein